jgi:hypothetical protein
VEKVKGSESFPNALYGEVGPYRYTSRKGDVMEQNPNVLQWNSLSDILLEGSSKPASFIFMGWSSPSYTVLRIWLGRGGVYRILAYMVCTLHTSQCTVLEFYLSFLKTLPPLHSLPPPTFSSSSPLSQGALMSPDPRFPIQGVWELPLDHHRGRVRDLKSIALQVD